MFVITGGGSGLGRALTMALVERGHLVLIIGRRENLLQQLATESPFIQYLCADVSTREGLEHIKNSLQHIPHVSGLVNNAGTLEPVVPLASIQIEDWHQAFRTNLDAALFLPQILQRQLINGRVLNIGSGAAHFPAKGWGAYCTSKAALSMLTRCWQLESDHIAFTSVMPGILDTEMQNSIGRSSSNMDPEQAAFYRTLKEQHRLISASTVALFLTWLLLDVDRDEFVVREWDTYDTSHHHAWLKPPHQVPDWNI